MTAHVLLLAAAVAVGSVAAARGRWLVVLTMVLTGLAQVLWLVSW